MCNEQDINVDLPIEKKKDTRWKAINGKTCSGDIPATKQALTETRRGGSRRLVSIVVGQEFEKLLACLEPVVRLGDDGVSEMFEEGVKCEVDLSG